MGKVETNLSIFFQSRKRFARLYIKVEKTFNTTRQR